MNQSTRALWRLLVLVLSLGSGLMAGTVQKERMIVLISLDGFPAYALDDPRLPIPTLRKLAREGIVASSMQPVNPTVTWANHTAIVTGVDASRHQVLFNGCLSRPAAGAKPFVDAGCSKESLVHATTIYDIAYQAGLTTAQVDWVAINRADTITWKFPELPGPDGPVERELTADGVVTADQLCTFEDSSQAWQDQIWTAAAVQIIEEHKPNLLMFHLLGLDDANHEYGPMSHASLTAMALLDSRVKQIVNVLERTGAVRNATLMVVSDHGFAKISRKINPNVLLRKHGLLKEAQGVTVGSAWVLSEGGSAMVYVADPSRRMELIPKLRTILTGAEGIDQVYRSEDLPRLGLPVPDQTDQAPDLVLFAKTDYMFGNDAIGEYVTPASEGGTHGYSNSDPRMQAIFIAWGAGVPRGVRLGAISNLDVAPTIAALLGLEMPQANGHVIEQLVNAAAVGQ